jgi:hypothetical protein
MRWLNQADVAAQLPEESLQQFQELGRGFWLATREGEVDSGSGIIVHYLPARELRIIEAPKARRDVRRLVDRYDPRNEFVLVVMDSVGDTVDAYRVGITHPEQN